MPVTRIISGGQTGADRAALDVAIALGLEHGGWCPRSRLAEDGRIPYKYHMRETASEEYPERTERNVLDSDGSLILCRGTPVGGTDLTIRLAWRKNRPCLVVDLEESPSAEDVARWIEDFKIGVLNVAGPRESQSPGIGAQCADFLRRVLGAK